MRTRFTQSDIRRALKGAMTAGVPVKVEIEPNGSIHLIPIQPGAPMPKDTLQERIDRATW
jgi:hypothetical protein